MKMKTENLTGIALDWAVEVAEEMTVSQREFQPSTNWAQGGPIIEREGISIYPDSAPDMPEVKWSADAEDALRWGGPTPLVAAMRAYVVSKLGGEVDVPDELTMLGVQNEAE